MNFKESFLGIVVEITVVVEVEIEVAVAVVVVVVVVKIGNIVRNEVSNEARKNEIK